LHHLSRSEVDGVTLAEIGRVKLHHTSIVLAMTVMVWLPVGVAAPLLSVATVGSVSIAAAPIGRLMIVSLYAYGLRRLCRSRDRLCAGLSDDPASLIAALVRISDINREPLTRPWWQTWLTTHPPMMTRLRGIAAAAQLSEEQLQAGIALGKAAPRDGYALAPASAPSRDAAPEPAVAGAPTAS
jgi:Zn-dependent protease with chaperone function